MKLFLILFLAAASGLQAAGPVVNQLVIIDSSTGKALQPPLIYGTRCYYTATCNAATKSVVFNFDGKIETSDNTVPFQSVSSVPPVGSHTLIATPYAKTNARGRSGLNMTVSFNVEAAPTPTPTASPSPTPSPTPTATPTATPTPATPTPQPTATSSPSPTPTPAKASVTASWTASTSTGVTGYKVKWGTASHVYPNSVDAGNVLTTKILNQFDVGTTYYFTVTAYTATTESVPASEVSYKPTTPGMHKLKLKKKK